MIERIKLWWSNLDLHKELREIAITLNHFNIIEIAVVGIFTWLCIDTVLFLKAYITNTEVNDATKTLINTAIMGLTATLIPFSASVFGGIKEINGSLRKDK